MGKNKLPSSLQSVIQYLMVKRLAPVSKIIEILRGNSEISELDVKDALSLINNRLEPLKQKVISRKCEVTGSSFCVFITMDSRNIKKVSEFSEVEEEYMYLIIKNIMDSHEGCLKTNAVLELASELERPISVSSSSELLDGIIKKGYLITDQEGICYLSCLALSEIEQMIQGYDHTKCCLCSHLVVYGDSCPNCSVRAHNYCLKVMFGELRSSPCPSCSEPWPALCLDK